jgi:hypothetical protein
MVSENMVSDKLLFEFFMNFAKFEFALKTAGFAIGNEKKVSPNWDKFTQSIEDSFDKSINPDLGAAVDFFLLNPPWKQVIVDGSMYWDASVPNNGLSEIEKVLLLIRRVRNNLFHGGKFNFDVHENTARTTHLLEYSIIILMACLGLSPDVKYNFDNAKI